MEIFIFYLLIVIYHLLDMALLLMVLLIFVWAIFQWMLLVGVISSNLPILFRLARIFNNLVRIMTFHFRLAIPPVYGADIAPLAFLLVIYVLRDILHDVFYQDFIIASMHPA